MKTLYLFFATILVNLFTLHVTAQNRKSYVSYMQFSSTVLHHSLPTNNYSVVLYKNGVKVDSVFNKEFSSVDFILQTNQVYTFVFKKDGCENNDVVVSTEITRSVKSSTIKRKPIFVNMLTKVGPQIPEESDLKKEALMIDDKKQLLISYDTCVNTKINLIK